MAAPTQRLRVNNLGSSTNKATLTATGTTLTWTSAPVNMPAIVATSGFYLPITVDPGSVNEEIVWATAYTASATTATVVRAMEGTSALAHTKKPWVNAPTVTDFTGVALWIATYWYGCRQTTASTSITYKAINFLPFIVPRTFNAKAIGVYVVTALASSSVRLGIYATNGSGKPGALVVDAGTVATTGTGNKNIALTPHQTLAPGVYWLACSHQGATGTLAIRRAYPVWAEATEFGVNAQTVFGSTSFAGWKSTASTFTGALPSTGPAVTAITGTGFPAILVQSA